MGAAVGVELDAAARERLTRVAVSAKGQVIPEGVGPCQPREFGVA